MNLLETIKTASIDAINASKPVEIVFGIVLSVNPLKINLEQKFTLSESFLIVPEDFTDRKINIVIDDEEKENKNKNALKVDDKLILARLQGGQKYLVLSRLAEVDA